MDYPVIYAPGHTVIGRASTERGAICHASRRISKLPCERWTASLRKRLGDNDEPARLAWFVGPQLIPASERRR